MLSTILIIIKVIFIGAVSYFFQLVEELLCGTKGISRVLLLLFYRLVRTACTSRVAIRWDRIYILN